MQKDFTLGGLPPATSMDVFFAVVDAAGNRMEQKDVLKSKVKLLTEFPL